MLVFSFFDSFIITYVYFIELGQSGIKLGT